MVDHQYSIFCLAHIHLQHISFPSALLKSFQGILDPEEGVASVGDLQDLLVVEGGLEQLGAGVFFVEEGGEGEEEEAAGDVAGYCYFYPQGKHS